MKLSSARPFFISPPFGTYFNHPHAYSVLGSFTEYARPGRLGQILRTVRPVPGGWINKIGLRNPGMPTLMHHPVKPHQVISLALIDGDRREWDAIISFVMEYTGRHHRLHPIFEINISCPNTDHPVPAKPDTDHMKRLINAAVPSGGLIFKLQPLESSVGLSFFLADNGAEYIHLSNTLPSPIGGISGQEQWKVNLPLVDKVSNMLAGYDLEIIGGGGIYTVDHLKAYTAAGATRFSLSTAWTWPPRAKRIIGAARNPILADTRIIASSGDGGHFPVGTKVTASWYIQGADGTRFPIFKRVMAKPPSELRDRPELTALIAASKAAYDAMTPEQQEAHDEAQRASFVRGNIELDRLEREERMTTRIMPRS